jgi:hypothetical protein
MTRQRAIDLRERETIDEAAFKQLIRPMSAADRGAGQDGRYLCGSVSLC